MSGFFTGLGRASVRFRWLVVALWILAVIVTGRMLPSLGSQVNNDNSQFLPASAPSNAAATLAIPLLGDQNHYSQVVIVASRAATPLGAADRAALGRELKAASALPLVVATRLIGTSADGHAAQLFVRARINQADITGEKALISGIDTSFSRIGAPAGLELHVAGPVASNVANQSRSDKTGKQTQALSLLFIVVLLLVIFRSVLAPIVTLLPAALALLISGRLIGGLGAQGLKISEITQLLLIVLVLGAGTDYGLFLVFRVREEVRAGRATRDAVAHALARVGESITASAGTVILALLSLLLASFGIYRNLGIPLAIGVAVMLLAGLTLLPALLAILGRAVFWPARVRSGTHRDGWWGAIAARVLRRPGATLALGVVFFAALASATFGYRSGGFGGAVNAPAGSDAAVGDALLARYFPEASANPTNLVFGFASPVFANPAALARGEAALARSPLFGRVAGPLDATGLTLTPATYAHLHAALGPADLLGAQPPTTVRGVSAAQYNAYRASAAFISRDGRTIQYEVSLAAGNPQSAQALAAIPAVRAETARLATTLGARASGVAGEAPALYDVGATSNHDLGTIVPIAIAAIALLLALVLRSAVAPLYLIVSVALSYLAALGLAVIVFIDIGGDAGLTFILPFLMFIFLLALGEDYNILVMTRIREEAHDHPLREAVARAVGRTGSTITSAGLVLAGTFAVLALAGGGGPGGSQIQAIGFGLAIGVLMDTFLVRTLLVPATVVLLGRWNWWPVRLEPRAPHAEDARAVPVAAAVAEGPGS